MLKQHAINPLFVLDEVDKSNSDAKSDPLGPLYQLLEEETAKEFVDEFVGVHPPIVKTRPIRAVHDRQLPGCLVQLQSQAVRYIQQHAESNFGLQSL